MKRLKNSVKAIIISICALVVVAAGIVGAVLLSKNNGGGGNGQKYILTPAQKQLMNVINAESKKNADKSSELYPYDYSSFVTEDGFAIDQTKITEIKDKFIKISNDDGDSLYYLVTKNDRTYLVDIFEYLKSKNLISESAKNFVVEKLYENYFFYSYEFNDNENLNKNIEVRYVFDETLEKENCFTLINKYEIKCNSNGEMFYKDFQLVDYIIYCTEDVYVIELGLSGAVDNYDNFNFINYTTSYVEEADIISVYETITREAIGLDGEKTYYIDKDKLYFTEKSEPLNFKLLVSLDSNHYYEPSAHNYASSFLIEYNDLNKSEIIDLHYIKNDSVCSVNFDKGYKYITIGKVGFYSYVISENDNGQYNIRYYDSNYNLVINYYTSNSRDLIFKSIDNYIFTNNGLMMSSYNNVNACKIKDIENEIVKNKYSKDYIIVNVGGFKILNSNLNDVTNMTFDDVNYVDDEFVIAVFEENFYIINLTTSVIEKIENVDSEKTLESTNGFSLISNGWLAINNNGKFDIVDKNKTVVSLKSNNSTYQLSDLTEIKFQENSKYIVINFVKNDENYNFYIAKEGSFSIDYNTNIENEDYSSNRDATPYATSASNPSKGKTVKVTSTKGKYITSGKIVTEDGSGSWIVDHSKRTTIEFSGSSKVSDHTLSFTYIVSTWLIQNVGSTTSALWEIDGESIVLTLKFEYDMGGIVESSFTEGSLYFNLYIMQASSNRSYNDASYVAQRVKSGIKYTDDADWYSCDYCTENNAVKGATHVGYSQYYTTNNKGTYLENGENTFTKNQIKNLDSDEKTCVWYSAETKAKINNDDNHSLIYYKLFWNYYIYKIYKSIEYTFKIDLEAAKVVTSKGSSYWDVEDMYDEDNKYLISNNNINSSYISGVKKKYYSYSDESKYKISGLSSSCNNLSVPNYKFLGWAINGGTKYGSSSTGYIAAVSGSTKVKSYYSYNCTLIPNGASDAYYTSILQKLSTTADDTVTLIPIFEYGTISLKYIYANNASSGVYYGIVPTTDGKYESKQLNPSNTIFSVSNNYSVSITTESNYIQTTYTVSYNPKKTIASYLSIDTIKSEEPNLVNILGKNNYILTNSQYQFLESGEWVITKNSSSSVGWGENNSMTNVEKPKTGYSVSQYFQNHTATSNTIEFYITYESRVYKIESDNTYNMNGSLNTNYKYFSGANTGEVINTGSLSKCEFDIAKMKLDKSKNSYVTDNSSTLYMGSAVYRVKLRSNSTPKYLLSKIVLSHFGVYFDSAYREATITITIDKSGATVSAKTITGGYSVGVTKLNDGFYRVGSIAPEGIYFNEFKISLGGTDDAGTYQANSRNFVIIEFRNLGIPGYYEKDISKDSGTFSIDTTSNKSGKIGLCIQPQAVTNNPTKDTVSITTKPNSESFEDYFITPTYVENGVTWVWLENEGCQINSPSESGTKTINGKDVYYDYSSGLVYAKKSDFIINYKSTSLTAIKPEQTLMKYSEFSSSAIDSSKYELKSYLSKISFGGSEVNFDCITRYDFNDTTKNSYGNLNLNISDAVKGNTKNKIYYLGSTYSIHSYWTYTYNNGTQTDRNFVLYLTRRDSDDQVMYFLFSEYSNDDIKANNYTNNINIKFSFKNFSEDKVIKVGVDKDNSDLYTNESNPLVYRFNKNGTFSSGSAGSLVSTSTVKSSKYFNTSSSGTNYYYNMNGSFRFNPNDFVILEIQPNNGYLIKNISISIGGLYGAESISGSKYNEMGMNLKYNGLYSTQATDGKRVFSGVNGTRMESNIEYTGTYNPFTASTFANATDGKTYNNGVYITDAYGSYSWFGKNTNLKFNSVYILIAGMYDNVEIEVSAVSYMEFNFNDGDGNLSTKTNASSFSDLDKLQMLVMYNGNWVDLVGTNALSTYPANSDHKLYYNNNVYTLTFFGCASLFNGGLKISATGDDYSSYFKNGKTYGDSDNNAFNIINYWHNKNMDSFEFLGRKSDGKSLFNSASNYGEIGKAEKMAVADGNSYLTYLCISDFSKFNHRDGKNDYEIFGFIQNINSTYKYEFNMKYVLYLEVKKNEIQAQVNSYLRNESITDSTTGATAENVYALSNSESKYTNKLSEDKMLFTKTIDSNIYKYQLDYVGTLKKGGVRLKSDSWFNDVILSNITYKYGSKASPNNWQDIKNYSYEFGENSGGNTNTISGYNLTYTYTNIPGYYLQYIEIETVDYGTLYLPVVNFLSDSSFSSNNGKIQKAFASNYSIKNMTLGLSYSFYYDIEEGVYTLKLYDDGNSSGNSGINDNINSLGILSNNIRVNFYSGSYTYKVYTHSNAEGTSSNSTLKYLNNSGQVTSKNLAGTADFQESFNIYYDSSVSIDKRMEMTGYTFIGWASQCYYNDESKNIVNRYDSTNFIWNSSSSWFNVTDYFKYGNHSSLLDLRTKDLYSYDFYVKSSLYPERSGYFITDSGYTGAIDSKSRNNYSAYNYSSRIENYNFWTVYSKIFTKYLTGEQPSTSTVTNDNIINLYGIWKANVYALKFDTNDFENGNNGSTPSSLNVITSADGGTNISNYNSILTNHTNFNDHFETNTYSGFYMNSETANETYYCYVTFDKNDWFISKSSLGSGTTAYDSYYSYEKDSNGGVNNIGENKNYLNIILDRYGYSWLGWFYQKKDNAKQYDTSSFTTNGRVFGSSKYTKYNSLNDLLEFNNDLYNQFTTKQEIHSEFVYYGEDVLVSDSSLRKDYSTYYISHYYYGNGKTGGDVGENDCLFTTEDSIKYFKASDYLNVFSGTKRIITNDVRKSLITYFDTSLVYKDYVVNGTSDNVNVKINRSNFENEDYRNITLYAYWEINSYEIVVDWQDTDTKSFNSHGSTTAGIYRDTSVYDKIKIKTSPDTGDFGKVTLQNAYFDDESLSTRLSNFNPVRVGYDFVGWTFYYYTDGNDDKNIPNLVSKEYKINSSVKSQYSVTNWLRNSLTYDNHIPIFQMDTSALNTYETEKQNKLSSNFETFGDGESYHTVYIFALWKEQTFNINVSLNISKENLENLYDIDSRFAVALYTSGKTASGDTTKYTNYTGINSSYYMNNSTFSEIVANLSFVVTFDGKVDDAYFYVLNDVNGSYSSTKFYLRDLFAVSTGYYLIDWLYDSDDTNSILVANTLKTAFASSGYSCDNKLSETAGGKSVVYTDNGWNGLFDIDFYNKVWVTNYKKNFNSGEQFNESNKTKLNEIDNKDNSSSFGFVTIGGKKYYILCEDVVKDGKVSHYQYFKYNGNKYYVLFYYNNGSNYRFFTDHENMYYVELTNTEDQDAVNINQRARYIVRYNSNGEPYVVTKDYNSQEIKNFANNIQIAVFTEISKISIGNVGQDTNLFKSYSLKTPPDIGTSVGMTFTPFSTRQFTIYAHWENKSDLSVVINNKNNSDTNSKSNPGLAGFYEINGTGTHTKQDVSYNQVFVNASGSSSTEFNIEKTVQTNNQYDEKVELTYNFYDNLQMSILPYYNGRYLSSMEIRWFGIEESDAGDTFKLKSNYKVIQYTINCKFKWDSEKNSLVLDEIYINKTKYGFQKQKNDNYTAINGVVNGTTGYEKLSLIDQTSFTSGTYYFMKIFDYSTDTTSNFGRIDINKVQMNMSNLMSSVEIDCKYSIQTYEVDFYSILDSNGNSLEIKEGTNNIYKATSFDSSDTFYANRDVNNAGKDNGSNDPYKTSEKIANRYFATIPQDCAEYSNVETNSFNVPYGYFMYGLFYDSAFYPHRPIDETSELNNVYDMLRDTEGQYKYNGYEYIYSLGYYYYGTNTTDNDKLISSDASNENKYSAQCAPVLGTKSKFDAATGIRLDGLSFYTFGGWFEYGDYDASSKCVLFIEYNKLSEATYLKRNITLYGYYYAVNEPTSITFYVYDDDQQKYVPYTGNKNEYTLTASNENNVFYNREGDNVIVPLENQDSYTDDTGIAKIQVFNRYGVGGEKFGKDMYFNNEFSVPLSVDDESMLNKLLRTYWYYEDTYNALYYEIEGVKHYIRYEPSTKRFYYLADESNLNSTRYYATIISEDFTNFKLSNGVPLGIEELYKYNFPGSAMYIKIPSSIGNEKDQYYELKRIESDDMYTTSWLSINKPRYYAEVYNNKYYILPRNKTDHSSSNLIYDENGRSNFGSDNPISSASIVNLDFCQIIYNDEYYEVNYLKGYDSEGSLYINPYYNKVSNTIELKDASGSTTTYFFDYETRQLYYEDTETNIVKADHEKLGVSVHCSVNDNYSINAKYDGRWQISGIKIKSLPSPNISFWYGAEQYGFVGYISLTDTILDGLKKSDKSSGESGTNDGGEIYLAFEKYIDIVYASWTYEQRLALKNSVGERVGSYTLDQFLSNLLVADSYELNEYKTAVEYINVNIPVKFEDLMNDPVTDEKISLSVIVTYKFNILSTSTEISSNIYAIPIYSPYVMEFNTDSVSTNASDNKVLDVDVEQMNVLHFELSNGSVHFYNPVNDDFINLIVLNYKQYEELKANNLNIAGYLTKMKKEGNYEAIISQSLTNSKLSLDFNSYDDGHYFVFAYYNKTGVPDSYDDGTGNIVYNASYVIRASDNFVHVSKTDSGMIFEITTFGGMTIE